MNKLKVIFWCIMVLYIPMIYLCIQKYNQRHKKNIETTNTNPKTILDTTFVPDYKIHIILDAGHGGPDVGAINKKQNIYEKNITRQMVDAVIAEADTNRYSILQTRPLDSNIHRHTRILLANKFKPQMLISFHCNSFNNPNWNGIEIHVSDSSLNFPDTTSKINPFKTENNKMAQKLMSNISYAFPNMQPRKIISRKDRIWIIYAGNYPSVLIEWGYISNAKDIEIMKNKEAQKVFADAVWHSINEYFGFQ